MRKSRDISKEIKAINDILTRCMAINDILRNITEEEFKDNFVLQEATIRQIEVFGEAVKRISQETRSKYPNFPWKEATGMRDKMIHQYDGIDLDIVWDTAKTDLPNNINMFKEMKKTLEYEHKVAFLFENLSEEQKSH